MEEGYFSFKKSLKLAGCGFVMGLADLFPGISGGTVAFILGIWERLIVSIGDLGRSFLWFKKKKKKGSFFGALAFLIPLILGITFAIFLFTRSVDTVLNSPDQRVYLYSAFIGLIVASSLICLRKIQKRSFLTFLLFIASMLSAIAMTYLKPASTDAALYHIPLQLITAVDQLEGKKIRNIDFEKGTIRDVEESTLLAMLKKGLLKNEHEVFDAKGGSKIALSQILKGKKSPLINLWIVFCGTAAVSAMLLPGISGSYLLVILGMYAEVIGNAADLISSIKQGSFDQESFIFLAQFALGIFLGAALFAKLIGHLFERYRDVALTMLAGFVLGSLRAVWPFWTFSYIVDPLRIEKGARLIAETPFFPGWQDFSLGPSLGIAIAGFAIVFLIEFLAQRKLLHA